MVWARRFVACLLVAFASCSSDGGPDPDLRTAGIYEAALRWALETDSRPPPDDGHLIAVYVAPSDGNSIATEAQLEVVNTMRDEATLRFTDAQVDALEEDLEGRPVKDDGVLVIVGLVADRSPFDLEIEVYLNEVDDRSYVLRMASDGDDWRVTAATET